MKALIERLQEEKLLFKSLTSIPPKEFGSRKKISIYLAVSLTKYYACILHINKKSRILSKEAKELMAFHKKLELYNESKIINKYIYIQAPLCSKAKALFEEEKWVVLLDIMSEK